MPESAHHVGFLFPVGEQQREFFRRVYCLAQFLPERHRLVAEFPKLLGVYFDLARGRPILMQAIFLPGFHDPLFFEFIVAHATGLQHQIQGFFVVLKEILGEAESLGKFVDDLRVRPALAGRIDQLGIRADFFVPSRPISQFIVFHAPGGRQHDIRERCRRGHEELRNHGEIQFHQGPVCFVRIGITHQGIRENEHGRLDRVRVLFQDRLHQNMRRYESRPLRKLEFVPEDLSRLPRVFVQQEKVSRPGERRGGQYRIPAGEVKVAADRAHDGNCASGLEAVYMLIDGVSNMHRRGLDPTVESCKLLDLSARNPGQLFDLVQREGRDLFPHLLETERPVVDDVLVVQLFLDDDLQQSGGKRAVAARSGPYPQVCELRHVSSLRIDGNQLAARLEGLLQGLSSETAGGMRHVDAPHDDHGRRVVVVAHGACPVCESATHSLRDAATPARRHHTRGSKCARQSLGKGELQAFRLSQPESDGFRTETAF